MKTFAICLLCFAASVGITGTVPTISRLCAGGDDYELSRPAFLFDADLTAEPDYRPLYFSWSQYYDSTWMSNEYTQNANLAEWRDHFGKSVSVDDLRRVIYSSTASEIEEIATFVRDNRRSLNDTLRRNTLVRHLNETRDIPFLEYLSFAKRCEPFVTDLGLWYPEEYVEKVKDTLSALLEKGKLLYDSCPSEFLRMRYGYQLVRLAHYSRQLEECCRLYDERVEPLKVKSIFRFWALEQKAGALHRLDKEALSAYHFAVVFDRCPSRRESAFWSFKVTSDSAWDECLTLCKTPREKTTLYFLRGVNPYGNALEEMVNIYKIDPSSDHLNVLLVRELNKFEEHVMGLGPKSNIAFFTRHDSFRRKDQVQPILALKDFVDRCVADGKVRNPDLWTLALAYMEYMTAGYDRANRALASLKNSTKDENIRKQIDLFQLAIEITRLRRIDDSTEDGLFRRVLHSQHEKLRILTVNTFEKLYELNGDSTKAYLCNHSLEDLQADLDLASVDRMIDWRLHDVRTSVDSFFVDHRLDRDGVTYEESEIRYRWYVGRSWWKKDGLRALQALKGTILLGQNRLDEAIATFRKITTGSLEMLRADPFKGNICDNRDRDFADLLQKEYSKLSLAESLAALVNKIKTNPQRAAEYRYRLGNAYYNMTHFGNAAEAIMYFRSPEMVYTYDQKREPLFFLDCSRALEQYEKAMRIAEASGDLELAARCCFMAAKCEQNRYYVTLTKFDDDGKIKNTQFRTYFARLRDTYRGTKFYEEAIKECKYFAYYVSRK